jgi:rhodanese-related sulfurtransferase
MSVSLARRHPAVFISLAIVLLIAAPVGAVPPPDFIINVGTQLAQFFSLALLFTTALASTLYRWFLTRFPSGVSRRMFWLGAFLAILLVSCIGTVTYSQILQQRKNAFIRTEIKKQIDVIDASASTTTVIVIPTTTTSVPELPLMIPNTRFAKLLEDPETTYFVLDAREDVEYEYGNFPGSRHIRYADLKAGQWQELPTDRPIIVLCWSGIRGEEVATFLRMQQLPASYLENGANGWVDYGGRWEGLIDFSQKYPDSVYANLLTRSQMEQSIVAGASVIDAREPNERFVHPYSGSIPIGLLSTPSVALRTALDSVSAGAPVITLCEGYVDCFEAKVIGIELERRGHRFLGRYDLVK